MQKILEETKAIQQTLHTSLGSLGAFQRCVLLDYPSHYNIGDHLIWLGAIEWLTQVAGAELLYVASKRTYSAKSVHATPADAPIFLNGGGNLGDLWISHLHFQEQVVSQFPNRQVVILPQSIYFQSRAHLEEAKRIFNAHPNLTLFTRDDRSAEFARKHFDACRVIKSPDMAFALANSPVMLPDPSEKKKEILYHCRQDKEIQEAFLPEKLSLDNVVVEDWVTKNKSKAFLERLTYRMPFLWKTPITDVELKDVSGDLLEKADAMRQTLGQLVEPKLHMRSLDLVLMGIHQLSQYRSVMTNRLHGHVLSVLLGIPHLFFPNSYHKNESFFETWTHRVPYCRMIKNPAGELEDASNFLAQV